MSSTGDYPFELLHSEVVNILFELDKLDSTKPSENVPLNIADDESSSDEECGPEICVSGIVEQINHESVLKQFDRINAYTKLEYMGYRTGYCLVERLCKELPRMSTELEYMKFICKEFWTTVFRKQVDNLRTNHQGVYVIQDSKFWLLAPFSATTQYKEHSPKYVAFSCGLIRGALANFCLTSTVTAAVEIMPQVKFSVTVQQ